MFKQRRSLPLHLCQLVTPSKNLHDRFCSAGFPKPTVIPNPIHLPPQKPDRSTLEKTKKQFNLQDDKITLLFVAAQLESPAKGMPILQEALARLPNPNTYQLIVVGHGRSKRNFAVKTFFAGPVEDREVMASLYQLSHATLIPSIAESYGMTGPEALHCGSQVLCNDLPVFRESMGEHAHFIENNDPQMFANTLEALFDKQSRPMTSGWKETQAQSEVSASYIRLYEKALSTAAKDSS